MHTSPGGPLSAPCFTDQSADETLGPWIDVRGKAYVAFYVAGSGTISSGVLSFEEAAPKDPNANPAVIGEATGGYSLITTYSAAGVTGGAQVAIHLEPRAYCFVRARISTVLAGTVPLVSVCCVAY